MSSMPAVNTDAWVQAANAAAQAKKQEYLNNSQGILNTINQTRDSALQNLDTNNTLAINELNKNKTNISNTALDNAKQANINRLLALKSNQSAMNRAGLGSQGVVGSQVNSINTNYNTNLNNILKQKATDLSNVDSQINETNIKNDAQKANLVAQYAATLAAKQQEINEKAEALGETAYANSYNANVDAWQKAYQVWLAEREEEDRLRNAAYQERQLELQRQQYNSSNYDIDSILKRFDDTSNKDEYFSNGYQPNNIDGQKLKASGSYIYVTKKDGSTVKQNIWQTGSGKKAKYYYWDGAAKQYKSASSGKSLLQHVKL